MFRFRIIVTVNSQKPVTVIKNRFVKLIILNGVYLLNAVIATICRLFVRNDSGVHLATYH